MQTLGLFGTIGTTELIVLLLLGLLIFGRRLPEVGKSLGKGIVEFRKGLKGVEDEIETETNKPPAPRLTSPPVNPAGQDPRVSRSDIVDQPVAQPAPKPSV